MKRIPVVATVLLLLAGCSANDSFVYKPSAPVAGVRKLPVKLAVLPFRDGTENYTSRKFPLPPPRDYTYQYNLAKVGIPSQVTALTPDFWAKGLADDMAASGAFRSVRFIYGQDELVDEDFCIDGTVEKANATADRDRVSEYALVFRAWRRTDKRPIWEKSVTRAPRTTEIQPRGGFSTQVWVDAAHADTNQSMRSIFAEAATDLMKTLAPLSVVNELGVDRPLKASPAPDSADKEIERILKGN
jgi:hypothetical protein